MKGNKTSADHYREEAKFFYVQANELDPERSEPSNAQLHGWRSDCWRRIHARSSVEEHRQ